MAKYESASDSLRPGQLDRLVATIKDRRPKPDFRGKTTHAISLRMPVKLLELYMEKADKTGRPYQTLIINDLTDANLAALEGKA